MEVLIVAVEAVDNVMYGLLAAIFGAVGGIFTAVVVILAIAFALLMKYNAYGYGIKKFIDDKGNKQWQFWVITIAQVIHIFVMVVFNAVATSFLGAALGLLLAYHSLGV